MYAKTPCSTFGQTLSGHLQKLQVNVQKIQGMCTNTMWVYTHSTLLMHKLQGDWYTLHVAPVESIGCNVGRSVVLFVLPLAHHLLFLLCQSYILVRSMSPFSALIHWQEIDGAMSVYNKIFLKRPF